MHKWDKELNDCLQSLDLRLVESSFLCGEDMTIADIIVFNDISLYMELMGVNLESKELERLPNLSRWFRHKMLNDVKVDKANKEMKEALKKITITKLL